jgi:hypothetical protein
MAAPDLSERRELIAAVAPRFDEVVTRCARRAIAEIPAYADVPVEDVRQNVAGDLGRAMAALVENRSLSSQELAAMGGIGDSRAQEGIPLEAMLRVYRITIDEVFAILWEASEQGHMRQDRVVAFTREVWRYADQLMDVAVAAYRRRELEEAVADSQRRAALVHRLLLSTGGGASGTALGAQLDPRATYVALRARCARGDERALLLDLQMPGVLEGAAVVPFEGDVAGFATARPAVAPGDGVIVGVGPAGPLAALPLSFAVATRIVETAAAFRRTGVLTLDALAPEAIARSEDVLGETLVARCVTTVAPDTAAGAELLGTVRTYLERELSVERTAHALEVHPNTVRNRLRRYEALTRTSLRSADDLLAVRLALLRAALESDA